MKHISTILRLVLGLSILLIMICLGCNSVSVDQKKPDVAAKSLHDDMNTANTIVNANGEVPDIAFESLEKAFGRVVAGEEVKTEFVFKNKGKGLLVIESTKAG
jgi:hypothetical protein